jgi:PAS domain S-box-containing protein
MLRFALDGVWLADTGGRILEVNEAVCRMLGYTRDEMVGMSIGQLEALQSPAEIQASIAMVQRLGASRFETEHRRKDGTRLRVEVSAAYVPDHAQFVCFIRDISDIQEERAQADRWRRTFTCSGLPLAHVDHPGGRILQVTRAYADARGYRPEEMVGMHLEQVVAPGMREQLAWLLRELEVQDHVVFEINNLRRDGSSFPTLVDVTLVRDKDGIPRSRIAYAQDLTELRRAEEAQRKGAVLLRTLLDTLPDPVWLKDPQGVYLECNARFCQFFGAAKDGIVGRTDYDFVDRTQADFFREHDRRAMAAGGPTMNEEEITFRDDGHVESLETIKTPIRGEAGELLGVLGIGRNISWRKQAEQALLASEERLSRELEALRRTQERLRVSEETFHKAFHTAPVLASLSLREDGRIIEVNDRYCQVLGYDRAELLGRTSLEMGIFRPEDRDRVLAGLTAPGGVQNVEAFAHARDGRAIPCLFSAQTVEVGEGSLLLVMALDITEHKHAEAVQRRLDQELHQVQKLDSLGSLAGGIAHDMNNVLAAIQAVTETLKQRHGEMPSIYKSLEPVAQPGDIKFVNQTSASIEPKASLTHQM